MAKRAADSAFKDILKALPVTLRGVNQAARPPVPVRLPLEDAIGPHTPTYLHPQIHYTHASNAAANIAGEVGLPGQGSDIFGDDDREIGGTVVIEVNLIDQASGAMSGNVRWQPHIHVKDTADFCPGNLGNPIWQWYVTLPMSRLEATGLTRDVPITIDYDLDVRQKSFSNLQPE